MLQVKFVSIPVRDQQKALEWYTEKLGCTVVTDESFGPGMRWIELSLPGGGCDLVLFTPPGQENRIGSFQNVSFTSDDVEKTYLELKERGVEFVKPAQRADWGGVEAIFKDLDGNQFVMASR